MRHFCFASRWNYPNRHALTTPWRGHPTTPQHGAIHESSPLPEHQQCPATAGKGFNHGGKPGKGDIGGAYRCGPGMHGSAAGFAFGVLWISTSAAPDGAMFSVLIPGLSGLVRACENQGLAPMASLGRTRESYFLLCCRACGAYCGRLSLCHSMRPATQRGAKSRTPLTKGPTMRARTCSGLTCCTFLMMRSGAVEWLTTSHSIKQGAG